MQNNGAFRCRCQGSPVKADALKHPLAVLMEHQGELGELFLLLQQLPELLEGLPPLLQGASVDGDIVSEPLLHDRFGQGTGVADLIH